MNNKHTQVIGKLRPLWLVIGPATAIILLTFLLWGISLNGINAAPTATLYVDGASGADTVTCGTTIEPCQTISYTLNSHAANGDVLNIAAGTYAENLTFSGLSVTLFGGYTVSGTQWIANSGETIIDGSDIERVIFVHDGSSVVLEQLTLTNGRAPEAACWGGGLNVTNGDATLRSVFVQNNQAVCTSGISGGGGGGSGGGGGGGGSTLARPVAAISIGPDGVHVEPIVDPTKIAIAMFTAVGAIFMSLGKMRRFRDTGKLE